MIPRVVHFVYGLRPQLEPFHLLHYLAIESCRQVVQPDAIVLHLHDVPYGVYWDLARPLVTVERTKPVDALPPSPADVEPYRYAHQADVIRLDVLLRAGGMYADIDTVFHRPVPESFWAQSAVIGREGHVRDPRSPLRGQVSLTNALLMAEPDAPFIARWRERIIDAMDGSWSAHSCGLATRLAAEYPRSVHVAPRAFFSPFVDSPESLRALLVEPLRPGALDDARSVHLMAHLWWDRTRTDFVRLSCHDITEDSLRHGVSPLAVLARRYLPEHGLF